jgi:hypothetical protein
VADYSTAAYTPDPETGIGRWTDTQIATATREGRRPDGSIIGPPVPIGLYRGISAHDLTAIVTYLRTVPSKHNAVTQHSTYSFPIEPYGPPIDHMADPADNPVARGAYIAGPLAHCMECHTPAERRKLAFVPPFGSVDDRGRERRAHFLLLKRSDGMMRCLAAIRNPENIG